MLNKEESDVKVFLSLGSNIGDRRAFLKQAAKFVHERLGEIIDRSSIYSTNAWGKRDQNDFLNAILHIKTELLPFELLAKIKEIEKEMGRVKDEHWGPRKIDIDIIYYADKIIFENDLIIPHPNMYLRNFVLIPLLEIAPMFIHPVIGLNSMELLKLCPDMGLVELVEDSAESW